MIRIYHRWEKWECFKAGFYDSSYPLSLKDGQEKYAEFLSNSDLFAESINMVFENWHFSCQNFLTNESINRIAWIGQSSVCIKIGLPSFFKGGFKILSNYEQRCANNLAREHLNKWLIDMQEKIDKYIEFWKEKDYDFDIPDECPEVLEKLNLAPSYKAIAKAILRNDHSLKSLGFQVGRSRWYDHFKKIEIRKRGLESGNLIQQELFN
jgi:hypothetical protein